MKLVVEHLAVRYPASERLALDDVSLVVEPGKLLAVVGPNGSGKTTLLHTALGTIPSCGGRVALDGRAIGEWPRAAIAAAVAALPQREEPAFSLTVEEAVMLGRWSRLGPLAPIGFDDRDSVRQALARCDLVGFERRGLDTLSGGEWQRVRVARALAASPRLLLLDEPTAAFDINHEMSFFELLRELVAGGLGVLVITHHLNLAARYASEMLVLAQGRVAANGSPTAVVRADVISRVFEWPVAITIDDGVPQVLPLRRDQARMTPSVLPDDSARRDLPADGTTLPS